MDDQTPATKADMQRLERMIMQVQGSITGLRESTSRRFDEAQMQRQQMFEYLQNRIGTTLHRLLDMEEKAPTLGNQEFRISRLESHVGIDR